LDAPAQSPCLTSRPVDGARQRGVCAARSNLRTGRFGTRRIHELLTVDPLGNAAVAEFQQHPVLMDYMPFTPSTRRRLNELADLQPRVLSAMHGPASVGDGAAALRAAADTLERRLGLASVDVQAV
jgi:hypothetical protein